MIHYRPVFGEGQVIPVDGRTLNGICSTQANKSILAILTTVYSLVSSVGGTDVGAFAELRELSRQRLKEPGPKD
ncbi:hypothetical protein Desti_3564 [Desulfomonile tiedjei DSM 6799]|uniref:Uncharacterized protein n=1 Tax=Desulfomonile tiedjei (strain ATCC 49306 / DSM 6799 / DCB-1) TaxID=706587 RepID=I4C9H2_DESTA|nr:hypothetical protein Desti_3564 [Desulfomonile tiedjei DSM 6799]